MSLAVLLVISSLKMCHGMAFNQRFMLKYESCRFPINLLSPCVKLLPYINIKVYFLSKISSTDYSLITKYTKGKLVGRKLSSQLSQPNDSRKNVNDLYSKIQLSNTIAYKVKSVFAMPSCQINMAMKLILKKFSLFFSSEPQMQNFSVKVNFFGFWFVV